MPYGKRAGERCIQLDSDNRCMIFGQADRPLVCSSLQPEPEMCGTSNAQAFAWLTQLEQLTAP